MTYENNPDMPEVKTCSVASIWKIIRTYPLLTKSKNTVVYSWLDLQKSTWIL
jgi:hypothetical protein